MAKNKPDFDRTPDEPVDGAEIAANILNRMPSAHREKLVHAIAEADPSLIGKIQERMYNVADLHELPPKSMQVLLQNVAHADVLLTLKIADKKTKEAILAGMSERKRDVTLDDLLAHPPARKSDCEDAQRKILAKLDELRTSGVIRTKGNSDVWV